MFWHIDADIISLAIIIIVYICNRKLPTATESEAEGVIRNRRFARCLEAGMVICVVDITASIVMEVPVTRFVYHLFMTAYFVLVELVIVEWFLYVLTILFHSDEKGRKTITHVVLISYFLYAAFTCLNPWTGLIYSLGPHNEYSRGPFFGVMIVLYALYTVSVFALILIKWKRIPKEFPGAVLLLTPLIIACAIVAQLLIPGWLLIVPSYMVCLVLAFLFLQTMRVRNDQRMLLQLERAAETDNLTGLYNRAGMDAMVKHTLDHAYGQSVVVLLADIDNLKQINDTMGHAEGDRSIRMVADRLKYFFRPDDTIVRYGGDEFLAFYTGDFDKTTVQDTIQRLLDELRKLRIGANDDVPLRGSIGASCGTVGNDSFETLFARADAALYYVKRNGKDGYEIYHSGMEKATHSHGQADEDDLYAG